MSRSLAATVSLYALGLAVLALAAAARGRGLGRAHAAAAVVLAAGAALNALVAGVALATGERAAEPVPFTGYLLLSLLVLPLGWRYARASPRRWDAVILALTAATHCVVCVRLGRTWDG
jgi:hypothetical protein